MSTTKDLAIILAGIVALTTFLSGVIEYARQSNLKRAEHFVQMRRRFLETPLFQSILFELSTDSERLAEIPIQDRRNFLGFMEEVALMVNSKLIRKDVAHYMFGYYVLLADSSVYLWAGLNKDDRYWSLFCSFAAEMRTLQQDMYNISELKI